MGALLSTLWTTHRSSYDDQPPELQDLVVAGPGPSYDDLPPELIDLVIARLADPADRARVCAVCRPWHSAVRRNTPRPWRMPSTTFLPCNFRSSFPRNVDLVGTTDDWLAVRVGNDCEDGRCLLHNPFFHKTVPLLELDAVIVGHQESKIYKFLMRSGADDFIAVITTNMTHAFMVLRPGKGVWLPPPWTRPYIDIIDLAFLEGKLYAITTGEDLIPFDLAEDAKQRPVVTMGRRLIKQAPDYHGHDLWPPSSDEVPAAPNQAPNQLDIMGINCSMQIWPSLAPGDDLNMTTRHLIESSGKLLMVKQHQQMRPKSEYFTYGLYVTRGVQVFEADTAAGTWLPMTGGLGGGRALFISLNFSKSVAAPCGEVEEDVIYFLGTGELFDLKSTTCRPSRLCRDLQRQTWHFHPELVFL